MNFAVQSGWHYARRITVSLPNSGQPELLGRRTSTTTGRTRCRCWTSALDKAFSFGGSTKVTGMLDVFNLMNNAG